jgi:hypothetical protein
MKISISFLAGVFLLLGPVRAEAQQWEFLGLSGMDVMSLETHSTNPQYIFAGTNYEGLYVSFDRGQGWSYRIATNVPIPFVSYDPVENDSLYAIVGESYSAGVYTSDDDGDNWYPVSYLVTPNRMGFDPVNPGWLYICFPDGIRVSQDYGRNFAEANNGLPGLQIHDVTGDGSNQYEAFAAGEAFVAQTTDFGTNWTDLGGLFGLDDYNPSRIAFEPNGPDTLYVTCWAYVARSFDRGETWHYTATEVPGNTAIACDPGIAGLLYVGSLGGGVFVSDDAGASFTPMNDDLGSLSVYCLEIDPLGRLLAGTADGVYIFGSADIPTMTEWGMFVLFLLMLAVATVAVVGKRFPARASH